MLDKFLFGNKQISEMYFGNIPVAQVYYGTTLIWEKEGEYVPYDSTCSIIITGDDTTQKFTVQVMKNGEDVTSSLDHFNGFAYIVNDVLPSYCLFEHNIPYDTVIASGKEFSITELINACKAFEGITDSRYDDTKGEYHIDANQITSKAGGSFPDSGVISCQNNIVVPYTLTEDTSTNDVWMVVSQNTSDTPIEIKTIQVATTYTGDGASSIYVIHESGVVAYKYDTWVGTPSVITKTIGSVTYNYVAIDLAGLSTGTFSLNRNEKYFIRVKHSNNNNNHYYYRNGGILGIVGYTTANINIPHDSYNISSLIYDGIKTSETDMLSVNSLNHFVKYTGVSNKFEANKIYKCKLAFTYRGELTNNDYLMLAANDGEVGYYSGPASELGITGAFVKSGAAIWVSEKSDYNEIVASDPQEGTIFKYTGNTVDNIFVKNKFYSCNTQMTIKASINSEPETSSVKRDEIYLLTSPIYNPVYSSGWNRETGFFKVTDVNDYSYTEVKDVSHVTGNGKYRFLEGIWTSETGYVQPGYYEVSNYVSLASMTLTSIAAPSYTVEKQNSPVSDETDNMKAKLTSFNRNTYFDEMNGTSTDLNGITLSTDHKYEVLMGA